MKTKILIITLFLSLTFLFVGCTDKPVEFPHYQDLSGVEEDYFFTFTSNLGEKGLEFPPSTGRTFYISNSGSDDNDGLSELTPIKTIRKVNQIEKLPGDKFLFKCGDVFSGDTLNVFQSGSDDNPIYFGSYGEGERPLITTRYKRTIYLEKVSNIVIEGLEFYMEAQDRTEHGGNFPSIIHCLYSNPTDKYKNLYIINNRVYSDGYKTKANGIEIDAVFPYGEDGSNIPHDLLTNVHVKYNEIFNIGNIGLYIQTWLSDLSMVGADHKVYRDVYFDNNVIYNIGQIGAYVNSVTNSTMNRNIVYLTGINTMGLESSGETGLMTLGAASSEIKFNEVYLNDSAGVPYDGMGIDIDWNCIDITVQYNNCYSNNGAGIATMANLDSYILNNRIACNKANGNQWGQLQVTDFTNYYKAVPEEFHTTRNLLVKENLIINDQADKYAISIRTLNGRPNWSGNKFIENRIVNISDVEKPKFIYVGENTPWYLFKDNKYYSSSLDYFLVIDQTPQDKMNQEATALIDFSTVSFADWQKRDLGSTFELLSDLVPSKIANVKASFKDNKLTLNWDKSQGDLWHYNVHLVDFDEKVNYTNMLGEVTTETFEYEFSYKGTFYIIIQPESNQGVWGEAVKIKVVIE
ncbi:MAG TPA: right-handed parallel beta-helix repeat-containing protein [Acholeplasmataceae bacterium]|nr:right-handed parallel beta-helix repeat-containing protein [Acholeplasmataceae bacterium]